MNTSKIIIKIIITSNHCIQYGNKKTTTTLKAIHDNHTKLSTSGNDPRNSYQYRKFHKILILKEMRCFGLQLTNTVHYRSIICVKIPQIN